MHSPSGTQDGLAYCAMAYNNAWANHRLLTACAALSHAEFVAPRIGFFPSLHATLAHSLDVDRFYLQAMQGGAPDADAACATAADLHAAQAAVDRRLIALVVGLDTAGLARIVEIPRRTHVQHERADRVLLHLFQHQIHHRGQAHAMLSATASPPQLDEFFLAEECPLRAQELAELGWSDEIVWAGR